MLKLFWFKPRILSFCSALKSFLSFVMIAENFWVSTEVQIPSKLKSCEKILDELKTHFNRGLRSEKHFQSCSYWGKNIKIVALHKHYSSKSPGISKNFSFSVWNVGPLRNLCWICILESQRNSPRAFFYLSYILCNVSAMRVIGWMNPMKAIKVCRNLSEDTHKIHSFWIID